MLRRLSHPVADPHNVFYSNSFLDLGQDHVHLLLVTLAFFYLEQFLNLWSFMPWGCFEDYSLVISPLCFFFLCAYACIFTPSNSMDAWILLCSIDYNLLFYLHTVIHKLCPIWPLSAGSYVSLMP